MLYFLRCSATTLGVDKLFRFPLCALRVVLAVPRVFVSCLRRLGAWTSSTEDGPEDGDPDELGSPA